MKKFLEIFFSATMLILSTQSIAAGTLKWVYPATSYSVPAVSPSGTLYIICSTPLPGIHAVNPDGSLKWIFNNVETSECIEKDKNCIQFENTMVAVGSDGTIYATGSEIHDGQKSRQLFAIDPDGSLKWSYILPDDESGRYLALATDGTIYISGGRQLYALDLLGKQKWAYSDGSIDYGSLALGSDGTLYVINDSGQKLLAISTDGHLKWEWSDGQDRLEMISPMAINEDGTILVRTHSSLLAFGYDGTLQWDFTPNDYQSDTNLLTTGAITSKDGTIIVGGTNHLLYRINPEGSLKSTTNFEFLPVGNFGSPAVGADETIYLSQGENGLYAFSPEGAVLWIFSADLPASPYSAPQIGPDGTVYVQGTQQLYAVRTNSPGVAHSSWPMYGKDSQHTFRRDALIQARALQLGAPTVSHSKSGTQVAITWSAIDGAEGYLLNYAQDARDIKSVDMGKRTDFSVKLWEGAAFYVAVQAYNENATSEFSNIEYIFIETRPSSPDTPIIYEAKNGAVKFKHDSHQRFDCFACHEGTPAPFEVDKNSAHNEACKDCHKIADGPTKCSECHNQGFFPGVPIISHLTAGQSVTISWSAIPNAVGYILSYTPDLSNIQSIDVKNQTSLTTQLWEGASFYIAVRSYNDLGVSNYSNIDHFTINSSPRPFPQMPSTPTIYEAANGFITFNHSDHTDFECQACHEGMPGPFEVTRDNAHNTACKNCHRDQGGPTYCGDCHDK